MPTISLRISIPEKKTMKMLQFDPSSTIYDACHFIRERLVEGKNMNTANEYGLFLVDEDVKKGVWLESSRTLDYYLLRNGDLLEYRRKFRPLRVRMLDGTLKTLMVDDSQTVANLMVVICTKIGIANYDEYSLIREDIQDQMENFDETNSNFGTLTLRRRKEEKERDAKMDELRKKLKTDDEVNWVDPSKTLREQGIDESETLLLQRKYFYSDQNIDSRDPVQLTLLYVQANKGIIDGTHPVTEKQACVFAGIQCQIQFGDYKVDRHRPGFLDLKEFLPQSYVKNKNIEKKIFNEHKKHKGLSELDAKVLYTKTARSLSTYGVTFFLVKEKMKGKNKLVPRLLGITKDAVLRIDENTKEILQIWPLTTVRRWGASSNTFTLDFGDYSDQYYSVQTAEAEQILQLISGYIDIILRKQRAKDHFGIEGDEGSTLVEDSISPLKATIIQQDVINKGNAEPVSIAKPAVLRATEDESPFFERTYMSSAQYMSISRQVNVSHAPTTIQLTKVTSVLTEPQKALMSTIASSFEAIKIAESELTKKAPLPRLRKDEESVKWIEETVESTKIDASAKLAAMNAATVQVVNLTSKSIEEMDYGAVNDAINTIKINLPEVTRDVRMIATLTSDGNNLIDATKKLCTAFSDLLKAAEPQAKERRQNLLNAVSRVGEASQQVWSKISEENSSSGVNEKLLNLTTTVANKTAALVLKAKSIAANCENLEAQKKVISSAAECALATSQLVACAKVVGPTLHTPECQTGLMNAVKDVAKAVENLAKVCNENSGSGSRRNELNEAAKEVTRTLFDLLNHIKEVTMGGRVQETMRKDPVESVIEATDKLMTNSENPGEIVKQVKIVSDATTQLIRNMKTEAEQQNDRAQQRRLVEAARTLAEATTRLVEIARQCATNPHDLSLQEKLHQAITELRNALEFEKSSKYLATLNAKSQLSEAARDVMHSINYLADVCTSANSKPMYCVGA